MNWLTNLPPGLKSIFAKREDAAGDDLWVKCPKTGELVWYYQHAVDHWDLDHPFERILVDDDRVGRAPRELVPLKGGAAGPAEAVRAVPFQHLGGAARHFRSHLGDQRPQDRRHAEAGELLVELVEGAQLREALDRRYAMTASAKAFRRGLKDLILGDLQSRP